MGVAFLLVLLIGAALRIGALGRDVRLHPDEALYATYARRIALDGDFLLPDVPLDKPPLGLVLTALSFSLWTPGEFAARLPTVFASILSLAVLAALARRLFGARVALLAALLLALSPFDLAFAATGFHDPPLTLFLLLTCLATASDRWTAAGVFAACAIATKQSSVQFLPVFLAVGWAAAACAGWRRRDYLWRLLRFAVPVIVVALALAAWSAARAAPTDFWTLGVVNPGAFRFVRPDEIVPRLRRWLELLSYTLGFGPLLILAALAPLLARPRRSRRAAVTAIIAAGLLGTLLLYWLVATNTYDRYLHPLVPLVVLLVAGSVGWGGYPHPRPLSLRERGAGGVRGLRLALTLAVIVLILPGTNAALRGDLPIGGDHGEHAEIGALAASINRLPPGSVVYDYWLGWELGFYLGRHSPARIVYQPSPEAFGRAACEQGGPSYLAAPLGVEARWLHEAERRGARVTVLSGDRLRLYAVMCGTGLTP